MPVRLGPNPPPHAGLTALTPPRQTLVSTSTAADSTPPDAATSATVSATAATSALPVTAGAPTTDARSIQPGLSRTEDPSLGRLGTSPLPIRPSGVLNVAGAVAERSRVPFLVGGCMNFESRDVVLNLSVVRSNCSNQTVCSTPSINYLSFHRAIPVQRSCFFVSEDQQ